jgi:hypothetical protein
VPYAGTVASVAGLVAVACGANLVLADGIPTDGGADVVETNSDAGVVYNAITDTSQWMTFDLHTVAPDAGFIASAVFDRRYAYFLPLTGGVVSRYDTSAPFDAGASWVTFDLGTLGAGPNDQIEGAAFDGTFLYMAPLTGATGLTFSYDTRAPFTTSTSWSTFNMTNLDAGGLGFFGAAFDGHSVYFVPFLHGDNFYGVVPRHDIRVPMNAPNAWSTFDIASVDPSARGFQGAAFDGQYIYLVPHQNASSLGDAGPVARYDTRSDFKTTASWTTFDPRGLSPGADVFTGAVFDGRYVHFAPFRRNGVVARYDTQGPFTGASAWSTFELGRVASAVPGSYGAAFDGRYVYFVPYSNFVDGDGSLLVRYDTSASFGDPGAWSTFDLTTLHPGATGFASATFDGEYLYLATQKNGLVARFHARTPPSLPPGFQGSFL